MATLLKVDQLSKSYDGLHVVSNVSFSLDGGQGLLLLGSNGAGKTTLFSMLAGTLKPDEGKVLVEDVDLHRNAQVKSKIGFVTHQSMLHPGLTVRESLIWFAQYLRVASPKSRVEELAQQLDMHDILERRAGNLSRGQSQRASIARAVIANPPLLLLDEPFSGLDLAGQERLGEVLRLLCTPERAVILTTHQTQLGLEFATDVLWIDKGKIGEMAKRDNADELVNRYTQSASAQR